MPKTKPAKPDPEEYDAWFRRQVEEALNAKREGTAKYRPLEDVVADHEA